MNAAQLQYKKETGCEPMAYELQVLRSKRHWILDCSDETALEHFGYNGYVDVPDADYIAWLESKVEQLNK